MAYKVDLHTHSILSYDGALREEEYEKVLLLGKLDCIAITDHNGIEFAQKLKRRFKRKIIVGEEIDTKQGQIIGLFLKEKIAPGFSAKEAAEAVRSQGGLVYIPHPLEVWPNSMQLSALIALKHYIDIIEVFNARGRFKGKPKEVLRFATEQSFAMAASSDSHGIGAIGSAFSKISDIPTNKNLVALLREATYQKRYAPLYTYFYPRWNKFKKIFGI